MNQTGNMDAGRAAIARVEKMETLFDRLSEAFASDPECLKDNPELQRAAATLSDYLSGGEWLRDYELDEHGLFPQGLKRGVLSEDGLYNLLCDLRDKSGSACS